MNTARDRYKIFLSIGLALLFCGSLGIILSSTIFKDWILIGYGIRALDKIMQISGIVIGTSIPNMILGVVLLIKKICKQHVTRKQIRISKNNQLHILENYARDNTNPLFVRERLKQLCIEMPMLEDIISKCISQLDEMDILQKKQLDLISANDARYLRDTIAVLNNVEQRLCQNFRSIINLCIAVASADLLDRDKITKKLNDNQKKLSDASELLQASVDWINQYNTSTENDRSEVENWIKVIRDSLKEEVKQ